MKQQRSYDRKGIVHPLCGLMLLFATVGIGCPLLINNSEKIFHKPTYTKFKGVEAFYDKNSDGVLSIEEKYFMYSSIGFENNPADYVPNLKEKKEIIEKYNEIDKAQFGDFDSVHFKNLEDSL